MGVHVPQVGNPWFSLEEATLLREATDILQVPSGHLFCGGEQFFCL